MDTTTDQDINILGYTSRDGGLLCFDSKIEQYIKQLPGMTTGLIRVIEPVTGQLVRVSASRDMKSRVIRFNELFHDIRHGVVRGNRTHPVYHQHDGYFQFHCEPMTFEQAQRIAGVYEELGMTLMVRVIDTFTKYATMIV